MRRFGLQYVSDLHLEKRNTLPYLPASAPNLALIGDIGNPFQPHYYKFLRRLSKYFDKVFLIAGNHEYWKHNQTPKAVIDRINDICDSFSNITFLDNNSVVSDGLRIIGSTLWCQHPKYTAEHTRCLDFMKKTLDQTLHDRCIVLTHYLPSYRLVTQEYRTAQYEEIKTLYYSDLDHMIRPPVIAWLCGHSHSSNEMLINGVYCGINATGAEGTPKIKVVEVKY